METTWNSMEKKEKMLWIKKAAEDQKRYEVRALAKGNPTPFCSALKTTQDWSSDPSLCFLSPPPPPPAGPPRGGAPPPPFSPPPPPPLQRELCEMRSPVTTAIASGKKMKFDGEPKKPPS